MSHSKTEDKHEVAERAKRRLKKHYDGLKANGNYPMYGMGAGSRTRNTLKDGRRRKYGFRRHSVRQKKKLSERQLVNRVATKHFKLGFDTIKMNTLARTGNFILALAHVYKVYSIAVPIVDSLSRKMPRIHHGQDRLDIFNSAFVELIEMSHMVTSHRMKFSTFLYSKLPGLLRKYNLKEDEHLPLDNLYTIDSHINAGRIEVLSSIIEYDHLRHKLRHDLERYG